MSMRLRVQNTIAAATKSFDATFNIDGNSASAIEIMLPAAKAGVLSTRTDNDTGILTLATGHGIQTGDLVDVYWANGTRYTLTVGTVVGNSVPIDGGAGTNLPSAATAITVQKQEVIPFYATENDLQAIAIQCAGQCIVQLINDADAEIGILQFSANELYLKHEQESTSDWPLLWGADVAVIKATQGDSTAARSLKIAALMS